MKSPTFDAEYEYPEYEQFDLDPDYEGGRTNVRTAGEWNELLVLNVGLDSVALTPVEAWALHDLIEDWIKWRRVLA